MARPKKEHATTAITQEPKTETDAVAVADPPAIDPFDGIEYYEVLEEFDLAGELEDGSAVVEHLTPGREIAMQPEAAAEWLELGAIRPVVKDAEPTTQSEPATEAPDAPPAPAPKTDGLPPILIEVVAPSLNRPKEAQRLEQALAACTIPEGHELKINVQRETEPRALPVIVNELVAQSEASIVVVLADHIVPKPGLIEAIAKAFEGKPAIGMVGLNIVNMPPAPGVREYCFFAISRPFIEHFPERQVLCPDYHHFYGDTELGKFASGAEAFVFATDAQIETHHVNNGLAAQDDTWRASRSRKKQDVDTYELRQRKGLVWGASFERVNP